MITFQRLEEKELIKQNTLVVWGFAQLCKIEEHNI